MHYATYLQIDSLVSLMETDQLWQSQGIIQGGNYIRTNENIMLKGSKISIGSLRPPVKIQGRWIKTKKDDYLSINLRDELIFCVISKHVVNIQTNTSSLSANINTFSILEKQQERSNDNFVIRSMVHYNFEVEDLGDSISIHVYNNEGFMRVYGL